MARTFLKAVLKDGTSVVSEFAKLTKVQRYARQVFAGQKTFNVWEVQSETHPASGEKAPQRTRRMIGGASIVEISEVEPTTDAHGYMVNNFRTKVRGASGERGRWKVPATSEPIVVQGITLSQGVEYPLHRDNGSWRDYIVAKASQGEGDPEVRFYVDEVPRGVTVTSNGSDADDDFDDGFGRDDDDED